MVWSLALGEMKCHTRFIGNETTREFPDQSQSFPLNTMNANTHPIEFFLAALINLFELICWTINHIAGHHQTTSNIVSGDQTTTPTISSQPSAIIPTQPHTNPLFTTLQSLTVKQLQATTGIRSSRYCKSDLIALAAAY